MPTVLERLQNEISYWTRRSWSFDDISRHYDELANDYDAINEATHAHFRRFTDVLRLANLPDDAYVLDVCARTGIGTAYFYQQGKVGRAICADVSVEMGRRLAERFKAVDFNNYQWVQIRSYDWPFADEEFETILSLESVEHFDRPARFIQELGRVTRAGGTLILSTPNVLWEPIHALAAVNGLHHSEGPHRFIPYARLREFLSLAGFQIIRAETNILFPAGPLWLTRMGEQLESRVSRNLLYWLGLRRLFVCQKLP